MSKRFALLQPVVGYLINILAALLTDRILALKASLSGTQTISISFIFFVQGRLRYRICLEIIET
jgi:hypothetical protein